MANKKSNQWIINPVFLDLGKLADRRIAGVAGKGTEVNQVAFALAIINSLHWVVGIIAYPSQEDWEEMGFTNDQADVLVELVRGIVTPDWIKRNVSFDWCGGKEYVPSFAWGGHWDDIRSTAKRYLQEGINESLSMKINPNVDEPVMVDDVNGFSYPVYGFILTKSFPQSINKMQII